MLAQISYRAKALAAVIVGAVVGYVATAVQAGEPLTIRGAVAAACGAVLAGFGVHQAPKNGPKPTKRKPRKRARAAR